MKKTLGLILVCLAAAGAGIEATDWPEFRGEGRLGVWTETGIVETFPADGLPVLWRTPIKAGFSGPAVANGRVFVTDFDPIELGEAPPADAGVLAGALNRFSGMERAHALDEKTGEVLWTHQWLTGYGALAFNWAIGPRATPTVDGDRVYVLGAMGNLLCLDVETGQVVWEKDYVEDYGADVPPWGFSGAPLVDGNLLIALVGGADDAKVVAFDKMTGTEVWRALPSNSEPGYSQPVIFTVGGVRQLIIWHPAALSSLDPATGDVYWEEPWRTNLGMSISTPVLSGRRIVVTSYYNGMLMVELDEDTPTAKLVWKGKSDSEIETDTIHSTVNTPIIQGDYVYGIGSFGEFRALNAATGERVWETQEVTVERARWASGLMIQHGDRVFINNDRGELIMARLSGDGFEEISRTHLIDPTSPPGNRRELETVNWTHPAYANRHIYVRNDLEIVALSAAVDGK
jgi:outer membrane protein assembly factor BamB